MNLSYSGSASMNYLRPEEIECRVKDWLKQAGWEANPFAKPNTVVDALARAEDEVEKLPQYFMFEVIQAGWPSGPGAPDGPVQFGDLLRERHSVLFAESGEGKTATRIMLVQELRRKGFVVEYLDFDPPPRSLDKHAREIRHRLSLEVAIGYVEGTGGAVSWLKDFCGKRQPVYVLVDNVEVTLGPRVEAADVEKAVEFLFVPWLLDIRGLWFKFFLPASFADRCRSFDVFRRGKIPIDVFYICWTEPRLRGLLEARIEQVDYKQRSPSLAAISADEHGQPFDLEGELIGRVRGELDASGKSECIHTEPGTPRKLLRLANEVIREHARNEPDSARYRLTRRDFDNAAQILGYRKSERGDDLNEFRRKQIQESIEKSYALWKEYDDTLRLASDPKDIMRYRREIEKLREEINHLEGELKELGGLA